MVFVLDRDSRQMMDEPHVYYDWKKEDVKGRIIAVQ